MKMKLILSAVAAFGGGAVIGNLVPGDKGLLLGMAWGTFCGLVSVWSEAC